MKQIILIIGLILMANIGYSQFVVEDPTVAALMGELNMQVTTNQLSNQAEFVQQTTTLAKTLEHMKEVKERLQQVNKIINQAIYYKDAVKYQLMILNYQIDYMKNIKQDKKVTAKELATVSEIFGDMLKRSEKLLSFATDILTDTKYEMSDAERLQQLKAINEQMTAILNELHIAIVGFDYVRKEKDLVSILENW